MEINQNPPDTRNKILSLLKIRGPSLPIHISKATGLSTLFAGAFLSELASSKELKISNTKVGGSPLYFLSGQEIQLENFSSYLPGKEKEAFSLLKQKEILEDRKQEPAIRVAIRNIKDFAFPFIINKEEGQQLFWRFYSLNEEQAREQLEKKEKPEIKPETAVKIKKVEAIKPKAEVPAKIKQEVKSQEIKLVKKEVEIPLITIKEKPAKKSAEKSDFVNKIISLLGTENIEILEEKEYRKKDYLAVIRINSDIGKIKFLLIAKDKKTITENDLSIALQKAQTSKMPSFLISSGQLNKKAFLYLEQYSSLIKFRRI
ncbi:MAG: hypothetical protein AABX71_03125 [Nanoarchaeota archaeon]